jgi:hypothetical protein
MEEKKQSSSIPTPDPESSTSGSADKAAKKRKRRRICYSILGISILLVTVTILTLCFTYLRLASPEARLGQVTVANSTAFIGNKMVNLEFLVRNSNYRAYGFGPNYARLVSGGIIVGNFRIPDSEAKARSTGRVRVQVEFSRPTIGSSSGGGDVVVVFIRGEIHGRVSVFSPSLLRRKTFNIDCNFSVNFLTNDVQRVSCR